MTRTFITPSGDSSYIDSRKAATILNWVLGDTEVERQLTQLYPKHGEAFQAYLLELGQPHDLDDIESEFFWSRGGSGATWGLALEDFASYSEESGVLERNPRDDSLLFGDEP